MIFFRRWGFPSLRRVKLGDETINYKLKSMSVGCKCNAVADNEPLRYHVETKHRINQEIIKELRCLIELGGTTTIG